jgi:hypothetical protein
MLLVLIVALHHRQTVAVANRYIWKVQQNDIIVAGTDGLFDSLRPEQIIKCVNGALSAAPLASSTQFLSQDSSNQQQQQQRPPWWAVAAGAATDLKRCFSGTRQRSMTVSTLRPAEDSNVATAAAAAAAQHAADLLAAAAAKAASSRRTNTRQQTTEQDSSSSSSSRSPFWLLPCFTPVAGECQSNDVIAVVAVVEQVGQALTSPTQDPQEAAAARQLRRWHIWQHGQHSQQHLQTS